MRTRLLAGGADWEAEMRLRGKGETTGLKEREEEIKKIGKGEKRERGKSPLG